MRFIIFYLLPFSVFSQQIINSEVFFDSGLEGSPSTKKISTKDMNFPWIEKYDFRTETRDSEFDRQEYTVRLSTSSPRIRKAQKALYDELRNAPDSKGLNMYCDQMMMIHSDWLGLYIIEENKKLLENLLSILDDKQVVYEKMFATLEIDPEKLLKLKSDRTDMRISLNNLQIKQKYLLLHYGFSGIEIDFDDFITVESISKDFFTSDLSENDTILQDVEIEHKKRLLDRKIALVNAEQRKVLDFVQVKYTGPHSDLIEERLSVGLSLQLSNSGSKKLKIQELKIKQQELNRTAQRNSDEIDAELASLKNKLQRDIETFSYYSDVIKDEDNELSHLSNYISQSQGASPLLLLDIKERSLSLKMELLRIKKELLEDYLKFLLKSQMLCDSSGINFFCK